MSDDSNSLPVATREDLDALRADLNLGKTADITITDGSVQLSTVEDLFRFAKIVAQSDMLPKSYSKDPKKVLVGIQAGAELGLSPLNALASGHVIDGKYTLDGSVAKGLVRARGQLKPGTDFDEHVENGDDLDWTKWVGVCRAWPAGLDQPVERRFSYGDAVMAGLWLRTAKEPTHKDAWKTTTAVWWKYPKRMLLARARGDLLKDFFSHVTRGLITAEEARDIQTGRRAERDITPQALGESPPDAVGSLLSGVPGVEDVSPVETETPLLAQDAPSDSADNPPAAERIPDLPAEVRSEATARIVQATDAEIVKEGPPTAEALCGGCGTVYELEIGSKEHCECGWWVMVDDVGGVVTRPGTAADHEFDPELPME